jgi:fermentation-respiration switch protein FrsA (DUF1100 family)
MKKTVDYFRNIGIIRDSAFPASIENWRKGFDKVTPLNCVERISPRPLLLVHSTGDKVVPADHSMRLFARAGEPKNLVKLDGDEHRLRKHPQAVEIVIKWLKTG